MTSTFLWIIPALPLAAVGLNLLLGEEVGPFSELPLWVPEENHAFETVNGTRAIAAGLRYRPLVETLRDTLSWARALPPGPRAPKLFGVTIPGAMSREREADLLVGDGADEGRKGGCTFDTS